MSGFLAHFMKKSTDTPTIVCLCGSARFVKAFIKANKDETMQGKIVLLPGVFIAHPEFHEEKIICSDSDRKALEKLHLRKIDLCDEILVLNVEGYIGKTTHKEIEYAFNNHKMIRYLEEL